VHDFIHKIKGLLIKMGDSDSIYTYSVSTNFPSGINPGQLESELNAVITSPALDYISVAGDVVQIAYVSALSDDQVAQMNVVIANHVPAVPPPGSTDTIVTIDVTRGLTNNHMLASTMNVAAAASVNTTVTTSWPYPVTLIFVGFNSDSTNTGDSLKMYVDTLSSIALTTAVAIGATTLNAPGNLTSQMAPGLALSITDGTNTDQLGFITTVDLLTNTTTVQTPTTHAFASGATVTIRTYIMNNYTLDGASSYSLGSNTLQGLYIPSNTNLSFEYDNATATAKNLVVRLEVLY
jgi:hypothetical protein